MNPPEIFGSRVIRLQEVDSTNKFVQQLSSAGESAEGTAVIAAFQSEGRGQKGTRWLSEEGLNLIVSFLARPAFLLPAEQFNLSRAVSLAVYHTISEYCDQTTIKWPNDIYVADRKIAGILIENTLQGSRISGSVIGIGINLNQTNFPPDIHAVSLLALTGKKFTVEEVFQVLCRHLNHFYFLLKSGKSDWLQKEYHGHLYGRGSWRDFIFCNHPLRAKITHTDPSGRLVLQNEEGKEIIADLKEISFVRG